MVVSTPPQVRRIHLIGYDPFAIHSGGINCIFADGHAKWVMETDPNIYRSSGTTGFDTNQIPYWDPWLPANQ